MGCLGVYILIVGIFLRTFVLILLSFMLDNNNEMSYIETAIKTLIVLHCINYYS